MQGNKLPNFKVKFIWQHVYHITNKSMFIRQIYRECAYQQHILFLNKVKVCNLKILKSSPMSKKRKLSQLLPQHKPLFQVQKYRSSIIRMGVQMVAQDSTQIRVNFIIQSASLVLIIACFVLECSSKPKAKEIGSVPTN